ncbi:MAG: hypothetical protein NDI69_15990 [Bacteriovoracaceae bacterium]|nr:hypothetical protein [Bacteriovoracaceae bacterium]
MKSTVLDNIRSKFLVVLQSVGNFLNRLPENKTWPRAKSERVDTPNRNKKFFTKNEKKGIPKEVYGYKGSGYKGKGNVNTDTATFNHPRKDEPRGRLH